MVQAQSPAIDNTAVFLTVGETGRLEPGARSRAIALL
jgi:hypothetical protein